MTKCNGKRTFRHLVLVCLAVAVGSLTGALAEAQEAQPVSPNLTSKMQDLLRKEMLAVEDASRQIVSALVAGNDARVAELAQNIHDSFILKQEMTPQDKQDLMAAVPEGFVARDRAFHQLAAGLAQAARDGDSDLQLAEFGRMIEACTACHGRYATDRFPLLAE